MNRPTILVCTPLDDASSTHLEKHCTILSHPDIGDEQLAALLPNVDGLIIDGKTYLSASLLERGSRLRVIGCTSPLLDRIDTQTAQEFGIDIITIPNPHAVATAEHIITIILQLNATHNPGDILAGKTLGLVGFGQTARQLAHRARAFGLRIIVNQPRLTPSLAREWDIEQCDLVDLLEQSDFISLHLPSHSDPIVTADLIRHIRPSAIVINVGSPHNIDQDALSQHEVVAVVQNDTSIHASAPHSHRELIDRVLATIMKKRPAETFSLDILPTNGVRPHELFDQKRVDRLKQGLDEAGTLRNPPIVTEWHGRHIILDGATRFTALKQTDTPHIAVQIVDEYELQTWYHAIESDEPLAMLFAHLDQLDGVSLRPLIPDQWHTAFTDPHTICYFLDRDNVATAVTVNDPANKLKTLTETVTAYTAWGVVERTLITDPNRLAGLFPNFVGVAIFPQLTADAVFSAAVEDDLLPAGLTRFVIPHRILNLNIPLPLLMSAEPHATKRAWLNRYIAEKQSNSRIRYYQEPIILIDP